MAKEHELATLVAKYLTWSPNKINKFRTTLLDWYDQEGRVLPWRANHDPYQIMVSEVMLQQTQVQTVLPYYERFLTALPTVADLAAVSEDKLLSLWSGLGYYSRARHLQKAAQQLVQDYDGIWPQTAAELVELSGVGPYTASAIASIAFKEPVAAVDGNAFRVFSRLLEIDLDITKPQTRPVFAAIIQQIIDPKRPGDFNQAIMDLGASYMTAKQPDNSKSPVRDFDASWHHGTVLDYPVRTKKARPVLFDYFALAIHSSAGWLLVQRPEKGMLARLWMFPIIDAQELAEDLSPADQIKAIQTQFSDETGIKVQLENPHFKPVKHTFTHQQWRVQLLTAELSQLPDLSLLPARWMTTAELATGALPTLQRKLMACLDKEDKKTNP